MPTARCNARAILWYYSARRYTIGFSRIFDSFYGASGGGVTCSAITPSKVNWFGWTLDSGALWVHCRGWPWQSLGAICAVATAGEPGDFLCKQRTISSIYRRPKFTKLEHNTSIGVTEQNLEKLCHKRSFFKRKHFTRIFNVLRFQASITPQWLQIAGNSLSK